MTLWVKSDLRLVFINQVLLKNFKRHTYQLCVVCGLFVLQLQISSYDEDHMACNTWVLTLWLFVSLLASGTNHGPLCRNWKARETRGQWPPSRLLEGQEAFRLLVLSGHCGSSQHVSALLWDSVRVTRCRNARKEKQWKAEMAWGNWQNTGNSSVDFFHLPHLSGAFVKRLFP